MKRVFVFLLAAVLALVAAGGAVVYFIHDEKFLAKQLTTQINHQFPEATVSALNIGQIDWLTINHVRLTKVSFELEQEGARYQISLAKTAADVDWNIFYRGISFRVDLQEARMTAESFELNGLEAEFSGRVDQGQLVYLVGKWKVDDVNVGGKKLTRLESQVLGTGNVIALKDVVAFFGDGKIYGWAVFDVGSEQRIDVNVSFEEIDINQLTDSSADVRGNINGSLHAILRRDEIQSFSLDVTASPGSEIKAALLQTVIERIPSNTQQRKELDKLIALKGFLPLDSALGHIETTGPGSVQGEFEIYSQRMNLEVKYPIQINIDGRWNDLLMQRVIKK